MTPTLLRLIAVLALGAAVFCEPLNAQIDFSQQHLASYNDTSSGSVAGINFTFSRTGGPWYNVKRIRSYAPGNLNTTKVQNYPNAPLPDQLEIARTGNVMGTNTFVFASNLPSGSYVYLQDNDNNEITRMAFLDTSGNRLNASDTNNFVIYELSTSGVPTIARTTDSITFTGRGSAYNEPLVAVRIKTPDVRSIAVSLQRFVSTNTLQVYFSITQTTLPVGLQYLKCHTDPDCNQKFHWKVEKESDDAAYWLEYMDPIFGVQVLSPEMDAKNPSGVFHWESARQKAGLYRIAVRKDNGLKDWSEWTYLRLDCGSLQAAPEFTIVNPVGSELYCTLRGLKQAQIQIICTGNGKVIFEGEITEGSHKFSAEEWVSGLYQIRVVDALGSQFFAKTFVKI